jgi:hypothetical protein
MPGCKSALPCVVDADTDAFTAETTASVPVWISGRRGADPCLMISLCLKTSPNVTRGISRS